MRDSSIKRLSMQEETGESGTPHLQGYLEFITKMRPLSVFGNFKAHWEITTHVKAAIAYTQKAETRTGKIFLRKIKLIRPIKCIPKGKLYDWQERVVEEIESEPDDRTINWIWEPSGNRGKSALVRYLCIHHDAMLISGKGADVKYMIAQCKEPPDIILYDIPRTARGYINYTALEEIKNGVFCSSKYESKMVIMNSPHVFCFANFVPELDAMSEDRWKIIEI